MSDSTSHLDILSTSQAQKEITANALLNAASPAMLFARRESTSSALTWGYYGGRLAGASIANGTVSLTASTTNYVVVNRASNAVSVSTSTTNWDDTATYGRAYKVVTGTATVTSYEDHRAGYGGILEGPRQLQAIAYAASITPDAAAGERVVVGTLTGNMTINAPSNPRTGAELHFAFTQDATGGRVITWNAVFKKTADGAGIGNQKSAIGFIYDGTSWVTFSQLALTWL